MYCPLFVVWDRSIFVFDITRIEMSLSIACSILFFGLNECTWYGCIPLELLSTTRSVVFMPILSKAFSTTSSHCRIVGCFGCYCGFLVFFVLCVIGVLQYLPDCIWFSCCGIVGCVLLCICMLLIG